MPDPTRVCAIVRDELTGFRLFGKLPDVTPDSELEADLGCDCLDLIGICCALDEALGIEIPDAAMERWERVQDVIDTVRELTGEMVDD